MKVLQKGSGAKAWSKKCTCTGNGNGGGGCRAKLLVEKPDLFYTCSSDYTGDTDYFVTFQCPECKVLTDIETPFRHSDLPSHVTWRKKS